jgi:hypothetical protein
MTGVLQFSESVRADNEIASRVFGGEWHEDIVMFPGSQIHNPMWSIDKHKNFNVCILARKDTVNGLEQERLRRCFFYENWM